MKDRVFFDTNVILYAFDNSDDVKYSKAIECLDKYEPIISTQVIREFANVIIKKSILSLSALKKDLMALQDSFEIVPEYVNKAVDVHERYKYSFYDSLIIASAIYAKCSVLFSEDMQDGQVVESVKIVNPFA